MDKDKLKVVVASELIDVAIETKGKRPTQLNFEEMVDVVSDVVNKISDYSMLADSFSMDDMKNFAEWCRNGLLNTEYNYKKRDELLERWQKNFR